MIRVTQFLTDAARSQNSVKLHCRSLPLYKDVSALRSRSKVSMSPGHLNRTLPALSALRGRERMEQEFTVDIMARRTMTAYEEVLG